MDEVYINISSIPGSLAYAGSADASYQGRFLLPSLVALRTFPFPLHTLLSGTTIIYPPTPAGQAFEHCKFSGSIGPTRNPQAAVGIQAPSTTYKYSSTAQKGRSNENKDNRCSEAATSRAAFSTGPHLAGGLTSARNKE